MQTNSSPFWLYVFVLLLRAVFSFIWRISPRQLQFKQNVSSFLPASFFMRATAVASGKATKRDFLEIFPVKTRDKTFDRIKCEIFGAGAAFLNVLCAWMARKERHMHRRGCFTELIASISGARRLIHRQHSSHVAAGSPLPFALSVPPPLAAAA